MFEDILARYGLIAKEFHIQAFGSGLINRTYKVSGSSDAFVLQQINTEVFKNPKAIARNLIKIKAVLDQKAPDYCFVAPLETTTNEYLVRTEKADYFRIFPFIKGSHTVNILENEKEAFEAARQFGKFTSLLSDFPVEQLEYTLPDFHNLSLRYMQFEEAIKHAKNSTAKQAAEEINEVYQHLRIVKTYNHLLKEQKLSLRVIHHDAKINNVLFDANENALCLVDLDTVMPGYFLSDVGDMMRTYLSPVGEEETDLDKITIRESFFEAIYTGYMTEMQDTLREEEKECFIFSGELMIYMQALRFLTDFLNENTYYQIKYPTHNLMRAKNQFKLLNAYVKAEPAFKKIMLQNAYPQTTKQRPGNKYTNFT